jgi:hypothetical protein
MLKGEVIAEVECEALSVEYPEMLGSKRTREAGLGERPREEPSCWSAIVASDKRYCAFIVRYNQFVDQSQVLLSAHQVSRLSLIRGLSISGLA